MDSIKSTSRLIVGLLLIFSLGACVGLLVDDAPYITFKREIDVGMLVAIVGLIATIFIMPFIVQKRLAQQDNINKVILIDIEAIHDDVCRLKQIYVELTPKSRITKSKYIEILALFKSISAAILALNVELEKRDLLRDFKKDVYNDSYIPTKESCTESLFINKSLDASTILSASESLNGLCSALRTFRYEAYK